MDSAFAHAVIKPDTMTGKSSVPAPVSARRPAPGPDDLLTEDEEEAKAPLSAEEAAEAANQPRGAEALGVKALKLVAQGPIAHTWRARLLAGPESGRLVALVVVPESATVAVRQRFAHMAEDLQAAGEAANGILRVHAVAPSRDAFLADLWTTGTAKDLSALRWPLRRRLEFVCRVAQSLESLHALGLAHGCLCPENVLIDDDLHPVLSEVGLASPTLVGDEPSYANYASPEVKAGEAPNARSDVFSVGRLLQEIVKGGETPEVAEVVRTCLAPPTGRYGSAADLERALAAIAEKLPEEEQAVVSGGPPPRASADYGRASSAGAQARPARERTNTRPEIVVRAPGAEQGALSALGRRAPILGVAGLLAMGIGIAGAFFLGGYDASLRALFPASFAVGAAAATWLLPSLPRAPLAARLVLAAGVAGLIAMFDPLALVYAAAAQRHLHGSEGARRAAIEEIVRLGRDFRGISLAGVDLAGLDLTGADLRGVDLSSADLSGTRLWGAEVEGATFEGARLEGANLDRTNLAQAQLGSAACDATTHLPPGWRCAGSRITR